ncbi:TlpA disulfide reductase family protein [Curvibacter delicatus]|uniref:TlpA disulfide reductase family protein n=1 Tax=Curvibacter delicatus TaxID=80879 RepID=UPI001C3FA0EB|nr:TlpA disulfide reductase family protein [Curvibacter delicatus]
MTATVAADGFTLLRVVVIPPRTERSFRTRRLHAMRIIALALSLLLPVLVWGSDLSAGQPGPPIEVKLLDSSQKILLSGATGKVTIVNFWATWCAPCREEMPAIQAYYDKHKSEGLQVIAISMDDSSKLDEVRRMASHYTFPVAIKNEANIKGFGRIWRLPSTFVIDRQGVLRKNGHEGDPTVDLPALEALVTPLLGVH